MFVSPSIFRNVSIKLFAICIKTGPFYDNSFFKGDILDISRQTIMMVSDAEVVRMCWVKTWPKMWLKGVFEGKQIQPVLYLEVWAQEFWSLLG